MYEEHRTTETKEKNCFLTFTKAYRCFFVYNIAFDKTTTDTKSSISSVSSRCSHLPNSKYRRSYG